ncbi:hypothetical protein L7F22_032705 [Adiantum nelumboides]|nr:hypothetical protein [Adiantum nelumboides]MCO5578858.1 hypothetical protein [Adiantum nelumboides]
MRSTHRILQDCPGDPYFTGRHLELSAELRRLQEMKSEFSHHASVSYWISTTDWMNKDFFAIHRERPPAGTTMRAIRDAGGALQTDPDQVLAVATEFYEDLFTAESLTDEILDAREQIWSTIHGRVTDDMRFHLMAPFTIDELRDAVHNLAPSSCPGDDGLSRGFFVTHWEILHIWLFRGCQDIFSSGCMPESMCTGSLIRMGFPQAWIRGVSALYRSASSSVTIGGHVGRRFQLSRSVRQGCPLASYLFPFVAEAMSDFFRVHQPALRGLLMPVFDEPDLIDQEYADDTLLFLHYTPDVLDMIRYELEWFCGASGARINWDKSYGILAGSQDVPTWGPTDFRWLRPGETCRYLGFQVGLDVSPEQQFSPVMQAMRRKLCYWSTRHLSMAGRALVANQVLLTSAWYVASCWTMHGGVMLQLKRLIKNFLFGGSDGSLDTRARVRWSTCTLPTSQGGLGIIDPEMQSRALLTKRIVWGLFPGNEPWKMLLQSALATVGLEKEMANEKVEVWPCDILKVYQNEMSTERGLAG